MNIKETIAVISTGMSNSGIGIVRVSGNNAIKIVDKIFATKDGLLTKKTHTISYGHIIDENNYILDEVLVMLMKAPRTYTGEDTVEINCHGGVLVVKKILELVIKNGARLALPGEFTKKAFLNGKMDLSKAEAVIDVINAKNSYALSAGMAMLNGNLKEKIASMRAKIINEIAFIESALDDPENYSLDKYSNKLKKIINYIILDIEKLILSFSNGKIIKEGIETVILGRPNAGKSSLLNLLLKEERAIVSNIEGTTRDIIKEYINIDGINLNIIDTAGIRETEDFVEKIGVEKAIEIANNSDFIIAIIDASKEIEKEDLKILEYINDKKAVVLLNKIDNKKVIEKEKLMEYTKKEIIYFSAKEGIGKEELESYIKEEFLKGIISFNDEIYITNLRHKEALEESKESLEMVLSSIEENLPEDFFSIDLLNAYESLGLITGETVDDDLANEIFSKFCMGK